MEDNIPQKATCSGNKGFSSMDIHLNISTAKQIFCQIHCPMLYISYLKNDVEVFNYDCHLEIRRQRFKEVKRVFWQVHYFKSRPLVQLFISEHAK